VYTVRVDATVSDEQSMRSQP